MSAGERRGWTPSEAERHLRSLELFGMRFGLDRMRRMMTVLGSPERRFHSIHVVGTNGKSSTTRMIAAILERHNMRTGAYLSPHLRSFAERVQIGERDLAQEEFASALARAAWAAERVNRTLAGEDHITQFELLTAAAYWALAERGVEVAVVEAGLGGRYDATSVISSSVTALTNVGLEHTRWLGPTVADIASEKLTVLRERTTLVLGDPSDPQVLALARELATERSAELVLAPAAATLPGGPPTLRARGRFQERNFALAVTVAERYLASLGVPFSPEAALDAAARTEVPGRFQLVGARPAVLVDGAHNPDAALALAQALSEVLGGRELGIVFGVLEDKDAAGMLGALLPLCRCAWFTAPPGERALSPAALESLARQQGFERAECEPRPGAALALARRWAEQAPAERVVLGTGSIYLVGELMGTIGAEAGDGVPTPEERSANW